ncbi:hypothetical protein GGR57DRAFT_471646 [Xylariaceae sp. FL1272]|nr:hypothetical protein GGR57DRAFT_471646 [Xylariaceae sp. FL1272]
MVPPSDMNNLRKRRAHKKSRRGCANCKLRSIKCDEMKPHCKKCELFNVICFYGSKLSPDNLTTKASFQVSLPGAVDKSLPAPLPVSGSRYSLETYQLVPADIPLIEKFQRRTIPTLGTSATRHVYVSKTLSMAFSYPLLMHVILAMADIHDLVMSRSRDKPGATCILAYHWYHAVAMMKRKLIEPIAPFERDALWLSSSLISISNLAYVQARTPEEAWPLCPPSVADLSWFKLCDGQRLVADLTNPLRPDSELRLAAKEMCDIVDWVKNLGGEGDWESEALDEGSKEFGRFFGLWDDSAPGLNNEDSYIRTTNQDHNHGSCPKQTDRPSENSSVNAKNPYYSTAKVALRLFRRDLDPENFLMHICFIASLDADFRSLLSRKDAKAMLLLLHWYARICDRRVWWLWKQSYTEGLAIYRYLKREWLKGGNIEGLRLIEVPMRRLLATREEYSI